MSNGLPNSTLYAAFLITCTCKYTVMVPNRKGTFLAKPNVFSNVLFALSICTTMSGSQVTCNIAAIVLDIETICEPGSRSDSTSPTPLINGYTVLNAWDSAATMTVLGFSPGAKAFKYCITGSLTMTDPFDMPFVSLAKTSYVASGNFSTLIVLTSLCSEVSPFS